MKRFLLQCLLTFITMPAVVHVQAQSRRNALDSLDYKIGQMIMIGIEDRKSLPENDPLIKDLKAGRVGGIVLFEKNIAPVNSKEKLKQLITDLQQAAATPLFISIDEEGGLVHRMKPKYGFVAMPSAAYLGRINNVDTTLYYNRRLVKEMSEVGINFNYAPDVDMAVNPENPVIAKVNRSFSADGGIVAKHAGMCILAHHEGGIKTILKHFPGHGSSSTDSHLGLVDVTNTWTTAELQPYKILLQTRQVDAIMTAHIVNRKLDPAGYPATLSRRIVQGLLRDSMGFQGVVCSDDMQMGAITQHYGFENAISLAINAGVDVLLFGNSVGTASQRITPSSILEIIKRQVQSGKISRAQIDAAYARIRQLKQKTY